MKRFLHILTYIILSVSLFTGCSLDVTYENQFSDPDAITTPETARELLADAYYNIPNPELDLSLLADDFEPTYWASRNPSLNNQYNWQPQPLIDMATSLWQEYYSIIVTINTLVERIPSVKIRNDKEKAEMESVTAEALTLKAYCYFQLLRLFADLPEKGLDKPGIVLKDKVTMENLPRSTIGRCIEEIRDLLEEAEGKRANSGGIAWMNTEAASLLRAELELYAGNYAEAAKIAETLVNEKGYDCFLPSVYRNLWDGSQCEERIFMFDSPDMSAGFYQGIVYDTTTGDYFMVSKDLTGKFSENDCRREWTLLDFDSPALGKQIYIGKYNKLRKEKREIMFINKMRLSGALFTALEAWCLNGTDSAKALAALNLYLEKRGADKIEGNPSGNDLLKIILEQKHLEFLGEGERYFDLKRYRATLLDDVSSRIPAAGDYRWLLPIPKEEYLYNENMVQNPEWPQSSFN